MQMNIEYVRDRVEQTKPKAIVSKIENVFEQMNDTKYTKLGDIIMNMMLIIQRRCNQTAITSSCTSDDRWTSAS